MANKELKEKERITRILLPNGKIIEKVVSIVELLIDGKDDAEVEATDIEKIDKNGKKTDKSTAKASGMIENGTAKAAAVATTPGKC